jgi:MFS family permease
LALNFGDVVVCFVLVYGSLMLVCGKMGDLFGHRLTFRAGLLVAAVAGRLRHRAGLAIVPLTRTVQGVVETALALVLHAGAGDSRLSAR